MTLSEVTLEAEVHYFIRIDLGENGGFEEQSGNWWWFRPRGFKPRTTNTGKYAHVVSCIFYKVVYNFIEERIDIGIRVGIRRGAKERVRGIKAERRLTAISSRDGHGRGGIDGYHPRDRDHSCSQCYVAGLKILGACV